LKTKTIDKLERENRLLKRDNILLKKKNTELEKEVRRLGVANDTLRAQSTKGRMFELD